VAQRWDSERVQTSYLQPFTSDHLLEIALIGWTVPRGSVPCSVPAWAQRPEPQLGEGEDAPSQVGRLECGLPMVMCYNTFDTFGAAPHLIFWSDN